MDPAILANRMRPAGTGTPAILRALRKATESADIPYREGSSRRAAPTSETRASP